MIWAAGFLLLNKRRAKLRIGCLQFCLTFEQIQLDWKALFVDYSMASNAQILASKPLWEYPMQRFWLPFSKSHHAAGPQ
jgi:hypothetical protein